LGISPNGVVTFVGSIPPGSTSDKIITLKSELQADKSFLIRDILPPGVSLNLPFFLDTTQVTNEQMLQTEAVDKARTHVERAIQRKSIFQF